VLRRDGAHSPGPKVLDGLNQFVARPPVLAHLAGQITPISAPPSGDVSRATWFRPMSWL
jgi:hypothetical protein